MIKKTIKIPIYDEEFFEWLRSLGRLDKYEAALDISEDYALIDRDERFEAMEYVERLRNEYTNLNK